MTEVTALEISKISGQSGLDLLVSKIDKLVSLPDIYYRLETAIESPASTVDDLARLLGSDPDLCARLLSLANSVFYSFPAKIETIDRAVSTIGLRQIRELVLVTSVMKMFTGIPIKAVSMSSFWEHSVAVGVLAKSIAQYLGQSQAERYYITGLLHDIGRLVLYLKLPDLMSDLLAKSEAEKQNLYILEQELLSYSHAEAGGRLLERWKVPQSIYEPVQYHHRPTDAHEYAQMACAIQIADAWVNKNKVGTSGEKFTPSIDSEATKLLGIQENEMDEIWTLALDDIKDVIRQFVTH
ncbi:MAG: HDOD domain-containing protein [Gammaproteobacteria bacterium]